MSALSPTPVIYRLYTARLRLLHAQTMHPPPFSSAAPCYGRTPRCQQPARNAEGGAAPPAPPPASPPPPTCAAAALREHGDPARPTGSAAAAMAGEVKTKLSKNLLRMKVRWGEVGAEGRSAGTGGKGRPGWAWLWGRWERMGRARQRCRL